MTTNFINAKDFGAVGDGKTDDTKAIQKAIDHCITFGGRLFIPAGTYKLTDTLQVSRVVFYDYKDPKKTTNGQPADRVLDNPNLTKFVFSGLAIEGEKPAYNIDGDTILIQTKNDRPVLAIQAGRAISISRIAFVGQNDFREKQSTYPQHDDLQYLFDDTLFNASPDPLTDVNRPRDADNRLAPSPATANAPANAVLSPYCGIAIDPFTFLPTTDKPVDTLPLDGGYPGDANQKNYQRNSSPPSVNVYIDQCAFYHFIVGVAVSPRGVAGNANSIIIKDCTFGTNKISIATCQTQSRNVCVYNVNSGNSLFFISTRSFGSSFADKGSDPNGQIALIQGGEVVSTKYLFNISAGWFEAVLISGLYCEGTLSLGFFGALNEGRNAPVVFDGCSFNLYQPAFFRSVDNHCWSTSILRFNGCLFLVNDVKQPLRFCNFNRVTFSSCTFENDNQEPLTLDKDKPLLSVGTPPTAFAGFEYLELVSFDDCWVGDRYLANGVSRKTSFFTDFYKMTPPLAPYLNRSLLPPGACIASSESKQDVLRCTVESKVIPIGSVVVTRDPNHDGVVTFTTPNPSILKRGDLVFASSGWLQESYISTNIPLNHGPCGVIQDIKGSTVMLVSVAQRLMYDPNNPSQQLDSRTIDLGVKYIPRFHSPLKGTTTAGQPIIQITSGVLSQWLPYDRIWGEGIPVGAYITKIIDKSSFEISVPAIKTATGVRLYDADVYKFSGTPM